MDFLAVCVWIWETLVLIILPMVSIVLAIVFIIKIVKAVGDTSNRWMKGLKSQFRGRR